MNPQASASHVPRDSTGYSSPPALSSQTQRESDDSSSDEDVQGFSESEEDQPSDTDGYQDPDEEAIDVKLIDEGHSMFQPGKKAKAADTAKIQEAFLHKCYTEFVKAEDIDTALEDLGVNKLDLDLLSVREFDPEVLRAIKSQDLQKSMKKQDGALKRAEFKVMRSLDPVVALWTSLRRARADPRSRLDISKCITLAEATVASIRQADLELKYQRRVNIVAKVLRGYFKGARDVVVTNAKVLEKDQSFLFGQKFEKLIKQLGKSAKLQKALDAATQPRRGTKRGPQDYKWPKKRAR